MRPRAIGLSRIVAFCRRVADNYGEHRMGTYAAALAYRGLIGLFPTVLIVVALVNLLGPPGTFDRAFEEVKARSTQKVPRQLQPAVEQGKKQVEPLDRIVEEAQKQVDSELVFFGVVLAAWTLSAVANTLADALNTTCGITETRSGPKRFALSLAFGPAIALAIIVPTGLMLTGSQVAERVSEALGQRYVFAVLWGWLRFPTALVLLGTALAVVYSRVPAVRQPLGSVVPGAGLAVVAWALATVGFSFYLANFADYGVTYGSLGAAVGLLIYLYLSASIVLAGAEVNAAIQHPAEAGSSHGIRTSRNGGTTNGSAEKQRKASDGDSRRDDGRRIETRSQGTE